NPRGAPGPAGPGRGDRPRAPAREPRVVDEPLGLAEPRLDVPGQHEVGGRVAEDEEVEGVGPARTIPEASTVVPPRRTTMRGSTVASGRGATWTRRSLVGGMNASTTPPASWR